MRALLPTPLLTIVLLTGIWSGAAPQALAAGPQVAVARARAAGDGQSAEKARRGGRHACVADHGRARRATRRTCGPSLALARLRSRPTHGVDRGSHHPGSHHPSSALPSSRGNRAATPPSSISPTSPSIANVLATPCENTGLTPQPGDLAEIEAATLCLVNQERARANELPLQPNARLWQAAQGHSEEMVSTDYFAHTSPSGLTAFERIWATGYVPRTAASCTIGENIAWGTLQLSTPSAIVAAWIASPEHLANILYSPYRDTAIGVAAAAPAALGNGQPGAVYSQEFGVVD